MPHPVTEPSSEELSMSTLRIRSIVVATDLHQRCDAVLHSAASVAVRHGAELHVVHAVQFSGIPYSAMSASPHYQQQTEEARRAVDEQITRVLRSDGRVASTKVRVENPPRVILERAAEVNADLIVMGPARPRAFRGAILGNTADHILSSSRRPVLVLRDTSELKPTTIVVPFDLGDPARGALDSALEWAGSSVRAGSAAAEVVVLYVVPQKYAGMEPPFDHVVVMPQLQLEVEDAQQRVMPPEEVTVRIELRWGDTPAEGIVGYAEVAEPDLLVLGTHGYGAIGRALIGSVSSRVVRAATCPMLLIPAALWAPHTAGAEPHA
jgi:nucleotide-binding universal stress UspA family protein